MSLKRWIWQDENFPNFVFDSAIINPLIQEVTLKQGYLTAFTSILNGEDLKERQLEILSDEAISTSAIEGEKLNRDSVRASIRKKLGLFNLEEQKQTDVKMDYLIDILVDANTNYDKPLDLERIFGWHNALFPTGYSGFNKIIVADFRGEDDMEVVSGGMGSEKTHYLAPPRESLEEHMDQFLQWFNSKDSTLIKAAIAHLWFVIIHPLDDGNGRITRAVTDLVLSKIENSKISKLYSMSTAINEDRKGYYEALDKTTGFRKKENLLDITIWCEWFLKTLSKSLDEAKENLHYILEKTKFWDKHRNSGLNERQVKAINKVLDKGIGRFEGNINNRKYKAWTNVSSTTALRDLNDLVEKGCLKKIEKNRKKWWKKYQLQYNTSFLKKG